MVSARSPPFKKSTPTNEPLLPIWKAMYEELIAIHPKSRVLEIIGEQHGVSRQCVMYHLFPAYKEGQKKRPSKKWSYEKSVHEIHQKRIDYKRKYQAARYHIDELVRESYKRLAPSKKMTLEKLSYTIHDISGIYFRPDTILGLARYFESHKRHPLLVEVAGCEPAKYRLSNEAFS